MVLRKKRGDTRVGKIEDVYNVDFGVRSDMRLDVLKKKWGVTSVTALIRKYWVKKRARKHR